MTATFEPRTRAALTNSWTTAGLAVVMVPSMSSASAEGFGFNKGSGCDIAATGKDLPARPIPRRQYAGKKIAFACCEASLCTVCSLVGYRKRSSKCTARASMQQLAQLAPGSYYQCSTSGAVHGWSDAPPDLAFKAAG